MKEYTNQINLEIKKILGSKLLIIFMAFLVLLSIASPILSTIDWYGNRYHYYDPYMEEELEVNGVVIDNESPFYWDIYQLVDSKEWLEDEATSSADDLALELIDISLESYVEIAQVVKDYEDYRYRLIWQRRDYIVQKFILEHQDVSAADMQMALEKSNTYYMDLESLQKAYYDITDDEKQEKLDDATEILELTHKIIITGDHQAYFDYMLKDAEQNVKNMQDEIIRLEESIVKDPANEEIFNQQIENLQRNIKNHEEITMPILQFRIENDIIPGSKDWRDSALGHKENALHTLQNTQVMSQEDYEKDEYLKYEYKTYDAYKKGIEKRIDDATNQLQTAEKSLAANKPDMIYVEDGTRRKVTNFLWYSLLIAVFATIFAGGLMAREFQTGTIRLLFIRPKGRAKIALSKFAALLIICLILYAVCILFNLITNGIMFGFQDLTFPNYTISSGANGISFIAYLLPKILACFVVVIFGASIAYFLSIVTRNTALSVSIPLVCFAGSLIAMNIIGYSQKFKWIIYTPLPYVNMPQILTGQYYSPFGVAPIVSVGIIWLLGLSIASVVVGTIILKKRDITN